MRLANLWREGVERPAALDPARGWVLLDAVADEVLRDVVVDEASGERVPLLPRDVSGLIATGLGPTVRAALLDAVATVPDADVILREHATLGAPFRRARMLWGIGLNYLAHARELQQGSGKMSLSVVPLNGKLVTWTRPERLGQPLGEGEACSGHLYDPAIGIDQACQTCVGGACLKAREPRICAMRQANRHVVKSLGSHNTGQGVGVAFCLCRGGLREGDGRILPVRVCEQVFEDQVEGVEGEKRGDQNGDGTADPENRDSGATGPAQERPEDHHGRLPKPECRPQSVRPAMPIEGRDWRRHGHGGGKTGRCPNSAQPAKECCGRSQETGDQDRCGSRAVE